MLAISVTTHECRCQPETACSLVQGATNFAVVSTGATAVMLVLFREDDLAAGRATHEIPLDPQLNRTGNVWHVALPALDDTLLYGANLFGSLKP